MPVYDNVPAPLTVVGTPSNNTINYEEGPNSGNAAAPYNGDSTGLVTVDNFEALEFSHKTTLSLLGLNGDDTFVMNNTMTPTGLTAISVDGQLGNNTLVVDANSMPVLSPMITSSAVNITGATPIADRLHQQYPASERDPRVLDALTSTGAFVPNGVEGVPLNNVLVGTFNFTDPPSPSVFGNPGDFTATINWGDGSATSGDDHSGVAERQRTGGVPGLRNAHVRRGKRAGTLYQISVTIRDKGSTRSFTPSGGVATQISDLAGASTTTPGPGSPGASQAMVISRLTSQGSRRCRYTNSMTPRTVKR